MILFRAEDCSEEKESTVGCKVSERIHGQSVFSCFSVSQEGLVTLSVGFLSVCVVPDVNYPTLLAKSIHYIIVFTVELGNIPIPSHVLHLQTWLAIWGWWLAIPSWILWAKIPLGSNWLHGQRQEESGVQHLAGQCPAGTVIPNTHLDPGKKTSTAEWWLLSYWSNRTWENSADIIKRKGVSL